MQTIPIKLGSARAVLPILVLGAYWLLLINQLRVEWTVNPQYSYGWAVPFLCLYLLWRRLQPSGGDAPPLERSRETAALPPSSPLHRNTETPTHRRTDALPSSLLYLLFVFLALAYAPTRLILEATPEWRVLHWALALEVVGLTLLLLHLVLRYSGSGLRTSDFAFPICYFLVAVPWLRPIEKPIIESLTRANVAVTIELLGLVGIPAVQHGNVIEVSTGVVGIDQACSGIRSFQATLMISLFLGELYRLTVLRRTVLCLAGFLLSFAFNVARTGLLTWVAARDGVAAIAKWHDPAGIAILVGCFTGLWAIGVWMKKGGTPDPGAIFNASPKANPLSSLRSFAANSFAHLPSSIFHLPYVLSLALGAWFLLVEGGTEAWFRSHEASQAAAIRWSVRPLAPSSGVDELVVPPATRDTLRYTEGSKRAWVENDGTRWQMMYFYWAPGRLWVKSVTRHPPPSCLSAVGWKLVADRGIRDFEIEQLRLGFHAYTFEANGEMMHVFYCLWEDGAKTQPTLYAGLTQWDRLRSALEGRRNPGMRVLEIALWGVTDDREADAALQRQLEKLIVQEPAS